jgi:hypothetical protein
VSTTFLLKKKETSTLGTSFFAIIQYFPVLRSFFPPFILKRFCNVLEVLCACGGVLCAAIKNRGAEGGANVWRHLLCE